MTSATDLVKSRDELDVWDAHPTFPRPLSKKDYLHVAQERRLRVLYVVLRCGVVVRKYKQWRWVRELATKGTKDGEDEMLWPKSCDVSVTTVYICRLQLLHRYRTARNRYPPLAFA